MIRVRHTRLKPAKTDLVVSSIWCSGRSVSGKRVVESHTAAAKMTQNQNTDRHGATAMIPVPIVGASRVRDGIGFVIDASEIDPVFDEIDGDASYAVFGLKYIDLRADLLSATNIIDETAPDKYAFLRDAYLQRRQYLIHEGAPPEDEFSDDELFSDDDLFEDDLDLEEDLDKGLENELK